MGDKTQGRRNFTLQQIKNSNLLSESFYSLSDLNFQSMLGWFVNTRSKTDCSHSIALYVSFYAQTYALPGHLFARYLHQNLSSKRKVVCKYLQLHRDVHSRTDVQKCGACYNGIIHDL